MEEVIEVAEEKGGCEDVLWVLEGDWMVAEDCNETVCISLEGVVVSLFDETPLGPCEARFSLIGSGESR